MNLESFLVAKKHIFPKRLQKKVLKSNRNVETLALKSENDEKNVEFRVKMSGSKSKMLKIHQNYIKTLRTNLQMLIKMSQNCCRLKLKRQDRSQTVKSTLTF